MFQSKRFMECPQKIWDVIWVADGANCTDLSKAAQEFALNDGVRLPADGKMIGCLAKISGEYLRTLMMR